MARTSLYSRTLRVIDSYWAASFGCAVASLRSSGPAIVVPQVAEVTVDTVYAMTFGGSPIISVPEYRVAELAPALVRWTREFITDPARAVSSLGALADEVVGPAWLGYADRATFRTPPHLRSARMLDDTDRDVVETLRGACTSLEWEHGSSSIGHGVVAGSFSDTTLAALAGYETWGERIAHIAVVSHPKHRGQGHARAAVAFVARHAIARQRVAQYRTLESNTPSRRVADSLGFIHVATSLAVRLR